MFSREEKTSFAVYHSLGRFLLANSCVRDARRPHLAAWILFINIITLAAMFVTSAAILGRGNIARRRSNRLGAGILYVVREISERTSSFLRTFTRFAGGLGRKFSLVSGVRINLPRADRNYKIKIISKSVAASSSSLAAAASGEQNSSIFHHTHTIIEIIICAAFLLKYTAECAL